MERPGFPWRWIMFLLFLPALTAFCEKDGPLPDAPPVHNTGRGFLPIFRGMVEVNRGEAVPPMSASDKMTYWLREETSAGSWFTTFMSAGFEQWVDTDPKYGSDSAAFGERLGAAALRGASMRFFSDSLLPTITHEDPRYFRMAHGPKAKRGLYAAEQVFVGHRDDGSVGFNYSAVVGHAMASALTMTYYPAESVNGGVAAKTFGFSLLGLAGGHLFSEFWPDVRERLVRRHQQNDNE